MPTYYTKQAGLTMGQTINIFKKDNNCSKCCYCGRLDPMARGLLLLLVDEECKDMPKYLNSNKEYKFEIIFGLSTDTDDALGIIDNIQIIDINDINYYINKIKEYICIGKFEQKFHNFSSKKVNGKSLWAQHNINININHLVEIFDISYDNIKIYNYNDWINNIITNINSLEGNFRQDNIINQYKNIKFTNLYSLPITINVSSGFYIRQLVNDIKNYLNIPLLTFDINRTKIINL